MEYIQKVKYNLKLFHLLLIAFAKIDIYGKQIFIFQRMSFYLISYQVFG
jgi:hypothetical protein